ncbi:MAG: hypothetical protein HZR80_21140 [Candidatus Heimdallarchaeota archaeon]
MTITKDPYKTINGRPMDRGICPYCHTPYFTTPKLAKTIRERGCLKCYGKKALKIKAQPISQDFERLSKGYKVRGSAFSRKTTLVNIYAAKLKIQRDADGLWYVCKKKEC